MLDRILSLQQENMLAFVLGAGAGRHMYWTHEVLRLPPDVTIKQLTQLSAELVAAHPQLAARIDAGAVVSGRRQSVERVSGPCQLKAFLGGLTADAHSDLLRLTVIDDVAASRDRHLWVATHHLATDAWSQSILVRDLSHWLAHRRLLSPPSLVDVYQQHAQLQRSWWQGVRDEARAHFEASTEHGSWNPVLAAADPGEHPSTDSTASWMTFPLTISRTDLGRVSSRKRCTPLVLTLTLWITHALRVEERPFVATYTRNRTPGNRTVVGYYANSVVLAPDLAGRPLAEQLHQVQTDLARSLRYQRVHADTVAADVFEQLHPCAQLFTMDAPRDPEAPEFRAESALRSLAPQDAASRRDVCAYLVPEEGQLWLEVHYRTGIYQPYVVAAACRAFDDALVELAGEQR